MKEVTDMPEKKPYNGLDVIKIILAVLVCARHVIQIFYPAESKWRVVIGSWLSNLAVPGFFCMAGFLLFGKVENGRTAKDKAVVGGYCLRIARMTLVWSALYLPIEALNWGGKGISLKEWGSYYVKNFFFSHPMPQLWYLPALFTACLLVWFCYCAGMKAWQILAAGWVLFCMGYVGDNGCFSQCLPLKMQQALKVYCRYFITMRNGVFYGTFFVAMGLWMAKAKRQVPLLPAAFGFFVSVILMYLEVSRFGNANMVMASVPAVFFMVSAGIGVTWKDRKRYPRLRSLSQWIYLSHVYFIHLFSLTAKWNPIPLTKKGIMVSVFAPMMVFCTAMVWLSEKERFFSFR